MKLVGIAWHWPGTSQDVIGVESEAATANRLRGYRSFHVNTRGWSDIGYNMAIDQAGRVWDLRGLGRVGAHAASASNPDANHEWMGVLLILGDRERLSAEMIRACQDFTHDVFLPRWPGRTRDTGHGRAPGVPGAKTSCPGPFAAELIVDDQLNRKPLEDDMPTAKEIVDELLSRKIPFPDWATNPDRAGLYEPGTAFRVDSILAGGYAHDKLIGNRVLSVIRLLKAQEPLLEAAAQNEGLSAEQVAAIAQAVADAVPDDLAVDVVDELHERLTD